MMKYKNARGVTYQREFLIAINSLILTATAFISPSLALEKFNQQPMQSSSSEGALNHNQGEYLIAQYASSCRRVMARNGLYVLQKPTVDSAVVSLLDYGTTVTIRDRGKNGWVPISSPIKGYILHSNFLSSCQAAQAATPPDLNFCRKVANDGGLVVRTAPSNNSARVGVVPKGQNVVIARGENGWVPISTPLMGYAQSRYLAYCRR